MMNTHTQQFILTKSHICRPAAHNTHERTKCVINPQLKIVPKNTIKKRNYILLRAVFKDVHLQEEQMGLESHRQGTEGGKYRHMVGFGVFMEFVDKR